MRIPKSVVIGRALVIVAAGLIIAGGATYAALQTQRATLSGNRMTSATADLLIGDVQGGFGNEVAGFDFTNLEPGGPALPQPGHKVILRNTGTSNLTLRLTANPTAIRNLSGANLNQVYIVLTPLDGLDGGQTKQVTLQSLLNAQAGVPVTLGSRILAGQTVQYQLQMQLGANAVSSTTISSTIEGIDLYFSGSTATE